MKYILRFYDFIRSWIYYPKMKRYLNGIGIEYHMSRIQYAPWHCGAGKLSDEGYKNSHPAVKDVSDGWKCVYRNNPLERS